MEIKIKPVFCSKDPEVRESGIFQYEIQADGTAEIIGIDMSGLSELWVPAALDGVAVTSVGAYVCVSNRLEKLTLSNGIVRIREGAFMLCDKLAEVNLPDTMTVLEKEAFCGCTSLTRMRLPKRLTEITEAFNECKSLKVLKIPPDHHALADVDGVVFGRDRCRLIYYPAGRPEHGYDVPAGTRSIGAGAFEGAACLACVRVPEGVRDIGDRAFSLCEALEEVTLPESLSHLGMNAFDGCTTLASIVLPPGITELGRHSFADCAALTSVTLPRGLRTIGLRAFQYCGNLRAIALPDGVETIGEDAFVGCVNLEKIELSPNHPTFAVVGGALFSRDGRRLILYPAHRPDTEFVVPAGTEEICSSAFLLACGLTGVVLPEDLTAIGAQAFSGCQRLEWVRLPESLLRIGATAFENCESLTRMVIPPQTVQIGDKAFGRCERLGDVVIRGQDTELGKGVFNGCPALTVTVPPDSAALEACRKEGYPYRIQADPG